MSTDEQRCTDCRHLKRGNECRPTNGERTHWQIVWKASEPTRVLGDSVEWLGRWCKRWEVRS